MLNDEYLMKILSLKIKGVIKSPKGHPSNRTTIGRKRNKHLITMSRARINIMGGSTKTKAYDGLHR